MANERLVRLMIGLVFSMAMSATPVLAADGAIEIQDAIQCLKVLSDKSDAGLHVLQPEQDAVLIRGERGGKSGLFVYFKNQAYFHRLPTKPQMLLRIPGRKDQVLRFAADPKNSAEFSLSETERSQGAETLKFSEALDERSRKLLRDLVEKSIDQLSDTFLPAKTMSKELPDGTSFPPSPAEYRYTLDRCKNVFQDSALRKRIADELAEVDRLDRLEPKPVVPAEGDPAEGPAAKGAAPGQ